MLTPDKIQALDKAAGLTTSNSPIQSPDVKSRADELGLIAKQSLEKQSFPETDFSKKENNGTGKNTTPMNWGKVLSDTWNTYINAPKDYVEKQTEAMNTKDIPYIGKSNNDTLRVGEGALAGVSSVINTILSPFGAIAKELTDTVSKNVEKNPDIIKSPVMAKVADFVHGSGDTIGKLAQNNPRAARNLGNAITTIITALSGEEGGKILPEMGKGLDTEILPGTFKNPAPLLDATKNAGGKVVDLVKGVKENVDNVKENIKGGIQDFTKGKSEQEILATPEKDVSKLSPPERKLWFDNEQAKITSQHEKMNQGIKKTLQEQADAGTIEAENLKKELATASRDKVIELRPKIVKAMGEQSKVYRNLIDEEMAGKGDTMVKVKDLGKYIDSQYPENPGMAQAVKDKLGIKEAGGIVKKDSLKTLDQIYNQTKELRQDMTSAAKKGTRVFTPDEKLTDDAIHTLTGFMKTKGVDFSEANRFWAKYAPLRNQLVTEAKPFLQTGTQTKTFANTLMRVAKETDVNNENFINQVEDLLGETINDKNKAIVSKIDQNEKATVASKLAAEEMAVTAQMEKDKSLAKLSSKQFEIERQARLRGIVKKVVYGTILLGADKTIKKYTGIGF